MEKQFIKSFFIRSVVLLALVVGFVIVFDPFYQYHKPLPGLKAVLTDKEYQCVGTLRNFDYNALIVGSSVCENYDNSWFNNAFSCQTIKAIRSYGATADLCYWLDIAYENHNLDYVFYNIDPSSLSASTEPDMATGLYTRLPSVKTMQPETANEDTLAGNIALLTAQVEAHPETTFKFFFSPYSMLWWDNAYRSGELDAVIYNEKQAISALLAYDNVEIYYYQDDEPVITNLGNYMDMIHFSKDINYYVYDKLAKGEEQLTLDNYEERLDGMHALAEKIVTDYIKEYYKDY